MGEIIIMDNVSKTNIGRIDSDLGMVVSHSFCIWYGLYYGAYH